jgi:hypothetical protein
MERPSLLACAASEADWAYYRMRDYSPFLEESKQYAQLANDRVAMDLYQAASAGFAAGGESGLL